ncbi:MAG: ChaN family lipoprotein [Leptospira sp.]|nr:ChaN family lipoprotein [Leptospira sp.]
MSLNPTKNFFKKLSSFFITTLAIILPYHIHALESEKTEKQFREISNALRNHDVLVIGEEHDDTEGHLWKLELIRYLSSRHSIVLSMEMLEWHQQDTIDEYLHEQIPINVLKNDIIMWKNFSSDYLPIVDFAKENKIPVLAANPPRKYVNKVSREGLLAYQKLSPNARELMPLPQNVLRDRSTEYEKKLRKLFESFHHNKEETDQSAIDRMILAQHIWDAGMTQKIAAHSFYHNRKIIHINGRFHSDYGLGVTYRLKKAGIRTLTVSIIPEERLKNEEKQASPPIADFLILTK